jgi:hypothetical protein
MANTQQYTSGLNMEKFYYNKDNGDDKMKRASLILLLVGLCGCDSVQDTPSTAVYERGTVQTDKRESCFNQYLTEEQVMECWSTAVVVESICTDTNSLIRDWYCDNGRGLAFESICLNAYNANPENFPRPSFFPI